ncbi:MAG TPA: hypothetical protein DDZ88_19715 [Verrucomicrobiales bacterium]|nr:hypothetical protein [Verrucomicrobiales bacterium]
MKPKRKSEPQAQNSNTEAEKEAPITTAEEADRIVRAFQKKPVGMLSEEEKQQRRKDFKRALAFNEQRFAEERNSRPQLPPAIEERDTAALGWCAGRCKDEDFQKRLEGTIINLVNAGALFKSPFKMIQASIEQLLVVAAATPQTKFQSLPSLNQFFDPVKTAQEEVAAICWLFLRARNINAKGLKAIVAPWVYEEAGREHFKAKWQSRGRRKTPHNRTQFEFIYTCTATFDAMAKELFSGPLHGEHHDYPPPRSDAAAFVAEVAARNEPMAISLNLILDEVEQKQAKSTYALGTPWASGWEDMRLKRKERVIEIMEPFIKNRWDDFKKQNPRKVSLKAIKSDIAKRPWKIAWQSLSNCLRTILDEWPYPPLDPDAAPRLIAKHAQRH